MKIQPLVPGCRRHICQAFKCEQIGAPNMTETLTHLKNCLWPRFRWIKERPWLDKVVKEMLCGLRPQQLSSSDWYHHCANRTNALGSLFPIINRSNIYTLIHHREKKKQRLTKWNNSVKEAGAIEKLAPFIIFLFLPFTVLWWIKTFLRLMG